MLNKFTETLVPHAFIWNFFNHLLFFASEEASDINSFIDQVKEIIIDKILVTSPAGKGRLIFAKYVTFVLGALILTILFYGTNYFLAAVINSLGNGDASNSSTLRVKILHNIA